MSQQVIKDFLLVNINVPDRTENTFIWLLTVLFNINKFLVFPEDRVYRHIFDITSRQGQRLEQRRQRQHRRETLYVQRSYPTRPKILFSSQTVDLQSGTSYVILLLQSSPSAAATPVRDLKSPPQGSKRLDVINIAVGAGDRDLFETLGFSRYLGKWSPWEELQNMFLLKETYLTFGEISWDEHEGPVFTPLDETRQRFPIWPRKGWIAPPALRIPSPVELQHFVYRPSQIGEDQTWVQNGLPRRIGPLAIDDLPSETLEPIYGFSFVEKPANGRVVPLIAMLAFLFLLAIFVILWVLLIFIQLLCNPAAPILFTLRTGLASLEITQRAFYSPIGWIMVKSWNMWRIGRLGITAIIPWTTGRDVCRFELQCECNARIAWKVKKEDIDLEPLVQLLTLASYLPEDRGRTAESYAIQNSEADNGQASSLPSQNNLNRRKRRGNDQQPDATGQDSQQENTHNNAGSSTASHEDPGESATGKGKGRDNEQAKQNKFVLSYIPDKTPQSLDQDLIEPGTIIKDTTLIRTIRRRYMKHRPWYCRMFWFRGFNNLTIAKFRLYHRGTLQKGVLKDVLNPVRCDDWSLPDDTREWDFDNKGANDSTISAYMSGIWTASLSCKCSDQNDLSLQGSPKRSFVGSLLPLEIIWDSNAKESLPPSIRLKFPSSWIATVRTIRIHARRPTKEDRHDAEQYRELLKNVAIDISCDCDSYYVFHSLPKKRNTKLERARGSRDAPFGWALWVEEDFFIPWYFLALINLVTIGAFTFGFVYSILHGNQAGGWAIASFLLSAVTFVFTQWVAKAKDSKRPVVTKGLKRE